MTQYGVSFIEELLSACQQVEAAAMSFHPRALKRPWKEDTMIRLHHNPDDWKGWEGCHDPNNWYVKEEAMKVTAKKPCVSGEYKVVEETERFYVVFGDTIGSYTALPKCDYEPVQEWVDVTGQYIGIQVSVPGKEDCEYKLKAVVGGYLLLERRKA